MGVELLYYAVALVISVSVHECTHAFVALLLGDSTAKHMGRLTLNPLAHFDQMGALMLLATQFHFGWGKPVQFNPARLREPKRDSMLIALSGPFSNFCLAVLFSLALRFLAFLWPEALNFPSATLSIVIDFATIMVVLNLSLMVFNLIPIPPLDGSKILLLLLPGDALFTLQRYQQIGYTILLALVFSNLLFGKSILGLIMDPVINFFLNRMLP